MIVILKGILDVLKTFADAMAENNDVIVLDIENPDAPEWEALCNISSDTVVITFNNIGTGFDIWKKAGVQLYNILVDHPAFYVESIVKDFYKGYHAVCVDREHVDYLNEIFPQAQGAFLFLPHGGIDVGGMNTDKDIDVLYAGGFKSDDEINFPPLPFKHDSERFYDYLFEDYGSNPGTEPQEAVKRYALKYGLKLSAEEYYFMTYYAVFTVQFAYLAKRRKDIVESLAASGLSVHICGNELWKPLAEKYPDNITYHGMLKPEECLKLIARTKVLINDHPNFADGSHERVFNGMLNGAVVLSNESKYLSQRFTDEQDILFWDGMNYEAAAEKVSKVLENGQLRNRIAESAGKKVTGDKWSNRLGELLETI